MALPDETLLAYARNSFALLAEAELLFRERRFARAAALAVLAVEEANKCWPGKWKPDWKADFGSHRKKLAASAPFSLAEAQGTVATSTGGDTGSLRDLYRDAQNDPEIEGWEHKHTRYGDIKPGALYVNVNASQEVTNDPLEAIDQDKAKDCLDFARPQVQRLRLIRKVKAEIEQ